MIGHALEAASDYSLLHGECVAIGMVCEATLAEKTGVASPGTARDVRRAVERAGLPVAMPRTYTADRLVALMRSDKKVRSGALRFALPREIGAMANGDGTWSVPVEESVIRGVLGSYEERGSLDLSWDYRDTDGEPQAERDEQDVGRDGEERGLREGERGPAHFREGPAPLDAGRRGGLGGAGVAAAGGMAGVLGTHRCPGGPLHDPVYQNIVDVCHRGVDVAARAPAE